MLKAELIRPFLPVMFATQHSRPPDAAGDHAHYHDNSNCKVEAAG